MTKEEFANCLAFIAGAKLKKLEAWQMRAWYKLACQHPEIPVSAWEAAAIKLSSTPGDWPTYDKFLSEAVEHVHGMVEEAMVAFENCLKASKRWYRLCDDSCRMAESMLNPDERAMIDAMGGWDKFQDLNSETLPILRGQFRKHWDSNQFQTRRMLNLPEPVRPKNRIEKMDPRLVAEVAKKLTYSESDNE